MTSTIKTNVFFDFTDFQVSGTPVQVSLETDMTGTWSLSCTCWWYSLCNVEYWSNYTNPCHIYVFFPNFISMVYCWMCETLFQWSKSKVSSCFVFYIVWPILLLHLKYSQTAISPLFERHPRRQRCLHRVHRCVGQRCRADHERCSHVCGVTDSIGECFFVCPSCFKCATYIKTCCCWPLWLLTIVVHCCFWPLWLLTIVIVDHCYCWHCCCWPLLLLSILVVVHCCPLLLLTIVILIQTIMYCWSLLLFTVPLLLLTIVIDDHCDCWHCDC